METERFSKLIVKAFEKYHYKRRKNKMWEQKYNLVHIVWKLKNNQ